MSEQLIGEKDSGDLAMRSDSASARRAMRTHGKQNVTRGHKSSGGLTSGLARKGHRNDGYRNDPLSRDSHDPLYLFACQLGKATKMERC
jgi:hypothetical protein